MATLEPWTLGAIMVIGGCFCGAVSIVALLIWAHLPRWLRRD